MDFSPKPELIKNRLKASFIKKIAFLFLIHTNIKINYSINIIFVYML